MTSGEFCEKRELASYVLTLRKTFVHFMLPNNIIPNMMYIHLYIRIRRRKCNPVIFVHTSNDQRVTYIHTSITF